MTRSFFCEMHMLAELFIDFVPHDAHIIYAAINRRWRQLWHSRGYPCVTAVTHMIDTPSLAQYAMDCDYPRHRLVPSAVCRGNLAVIKIAHVDCPWNLCSMAGYYGRLEIVQWAATAGYKLRPSVCSNAARKGHLQVIQWARANGCPWDELTCAMAARYNQLDVLRWAYLNGAPWGRATLLNATIYGDRDTFAWVYRTLMKR